MEALVYNKNGKETGKVTLPESVFGVAWNADLVHQVVISMQSNARIGAAHTKNRAEVRGGGRKPWRQKGTGQARHGSIRSPIWKGGGVAHGPRNDRNYALKVNKKMRVKALFAVLSQKYKEGEIVFIDELSFSAPKTKEAKGVIVSLANIPGLEKLVTKKKNAGLVVIPENSEYTKKSFNNFGNMDVEEVRNINALDLLTHAYIVIVAPNVAITSLENKLKKEDKESTE